MIQHLGTMSRTWKTKKIFAGPYILLGTGDLMLFKTVFSKLRNSENYFDFPSGLLYNILLILPYLNLLLKLFGHVQLIFYFYV